MDDEMLLKTYVESGKDIVEAQNRLSEMRKGRNAIKHLIIGRGLDVPADNGEASEDAPAE